MTPVPDDDFLEHIVMAVNLREKGKVGCAYYIAAEDRLLCMEEFAGGGLDAIQKCESVTPLQCLELNVGSET